jgi:hypothetical protein
MWGSHGMNIGVPALQTTGVKLVEQFFVFLKQETSFHLVFEDAS